MAIQQVVAVILPLVNSAAPHSFSWKDFAELSKDFSAALQSIATIIALIVGGFWTFRTFVKTREHQPRAKIEHVVSHRILPNRQCLLIVDVFVENVGQVAIHLKSSQTWLQQIVPLPPDIQRLSDNGENITQEGESEARWEQLAGKYEKQYPSGQFVIDSGERDQFRYNFSFSADVQTIQIYTYFDTRDGLYGWKLKTTYDIPGPTLRRQRPRPLLR